VRASIESGGGPNLASLLAFRFGWPELTGGVAFLVADAALVGAEPSTVTALEEEPSGAPLGFPVVFGLAFGTESAFEFAVLVLEVLVLEVLEVLEVLALVLVLEVLVLVDLGLGLKTLSGRVFLSSRACLGSDRR